MSPFQEKKKNLILKKKKPPLNLNLKVRLQSQIQKRLPEMDLSNASFQPYFLTDLKTHLDLRKIAEKTQEIEAETRKTEGLKEKERIPGLLHNVTSQNLKIKTGLILTKKDNKNLKRKTQRKFN